MSPPSTTIAVAVTNDDLGPARKAMTSPISAGWAGRPSGCIAPQSLTTSDGSRPSANRAAALRSIGVSTEPGQTQFTRMVGAWSIAIAFVSATTPPLEAE